MSNARELIVEDGEGGLIILLFYSAGFISGVPV
jgi:hypothetical protein